MDMSKKLYRSVRDRRIAGVCGGMAEYFALDATWVRLAAVALLFFSLFTLVVVYVAAWIIIPPRPMDDPAALI